MGGVKLRAVLAAGTALVAFFVLSGCDQLSLRDDVESLVAELRGEDVTPPTVASVNPTNLAMNVPINAVITATFSEEMDPLTITTATFTVKQGATPVTGTVAYSGTTATFTPAGNLAASSNHTAAITAEAMDLAGNALESAHTWSFDTGAAPDTIAPVPGGSGTLTADTVTASSFWLRWTGATDDHTTTLNLMYKIVASTLDNISTVADAETVGGGRFTAMDWQQSASSTSVSGLTQGTYYYVVLLVKDEAGNKAAYTKREGPSRMLVKDVATTTEYSNSFYHDYGNVYGTPVLATFTILNRGFGSLSLTGTPYVGLSQTSTVYSVTTQPSSYALAPGTTKDFIIRCTTDYSFSLSNATVTIPNSSPDYSTFTFFVKAYVYC